MKQIRGNPLFGHRDPGHFEIFRTWLRELGGKFELYRDLSEKKPYTGRRDPDKRVRQYDLDDKKYGMDPKTGTIWRRRSA